MILTRQQFEITSGLHKGKKVFIVEPTSYFPFERLLPELRQAIYKFVFANKDPVFLTRATISTPDQKNPKSLNNATNKATNPTPEQIARRALKVPSLLKVSHAIGAEAKQVFWQSQHFIIDSMASAIEFLTKAGSVGRTNIGRLTITKTGHTMATDFYKLLKGSSRLRRLTVKLPSRERMLMSKHIDKHYESLLFYLAAGRADHAEALRRLDTIYFEIGAGQSCFLDSKGQLIQAMTPKLSAWCKERIRGHLLEHYSK